MGRQLVSFFEEAERLGGLVAKIRLAQLTGVTSVQAAHAKDDGELVEKLRAALVELRASAQLPAPPLLGQSGDQGDARLLRRYVKTFLDLMTQRALVLGSVEETAARVNEAAADTLDVERVGVWLLEESPDRLVCVDQYERTPRNHSAGTEFRAQDYPVYFAAIQAQRTVAAHDAVRDPRTSAFADVYLKPLGISSMLDVPIWAGGRMVGAICYEHVGAPRTWKPDEETFAYLMSSFVSLAIERNAPRPSP